jgi:hypothetical protein
MLQPIETVVQQDDDHVRVYGPSGDCLMSRRGILVAHTPETLLVRRDGHTYAYDASGRLQFLRAPASASVCWLCPPPSVGMAQARCAYD